jgi:hypothetical protein
MEVKSAGSRVSLNDREVTIDRRGFNGTTTVEIAQILGVALEAPTRWNLGKLTITAAGFQHVGGRVPKPLEVLFQRRASAQMDVLYRAILAAVDEFRRRTHSVAAGSVAVDAVPADTTLVGELARLAQLHATGALTDEEFVAAKARLIG